MLRFSHSFAGSFFSLSLPLAALASGCGGAASSALFDQGGGGSGGDAAVDSGVPGVPQDASNPPPSEHDAGHDATTPPPVPDAAPPPVDANPPPPPDAGPSAGIECGQNFKKLCDSQTEVCCDIPSNGGGGAPTLTCESAAQCMSDNGASVVCAKPADCEAEGFPSGTVCCATQGSGGQGPPNVTVACVAADQCQDPGSQVQLCDPNSPVCPFGTSCRVSTVTIPPYFICGQ
ncbi:MAG TPA: hypothetical protein VGI39_42820 [Polyangiaceae bacterium]|jgi:hypothetical protein